MSTPRQAEPGSRELLHARTPAPPAVPSGRWVDVRPGPVATFDGDRLRYVLAVIGDETVARVDWRASGALERAVTAPLREGPADAIRFGDRAMCRSALGPAGAGTVERRLSAIVRREQATLVTWTRAAPTAADYRAYDAIVSERGASDG